MDSTNFTKMSRGREFWSELPPELLSKIAECLESRSDTQNFRAVCKAWKRSITLHDLTSKNILSPIFPYSLATCAGSWLDDSGSFSPVLVASYVLLFRSTLDPKLPPWFFTAEELHPGKLFVSRLLSPIAIRMLPVGFPKILDLSYIQVCEMAVFHRLRFVDAPRDMFGKKGLPDFNGKRVVLFVNPNCSKSYPTIDDCTAIILHHRGALCAIRLKDKQELDVSFHGTSLEVRNFHDVINFKGKIYAIDRRGRVYKMDYDTLSLSLFIENPLFESSTKIRRLAVSTDNQELYLIYRWCKRGTRDGIAFTIYKLNEGETKWDEVEGIGDDKILFVTFDGSFFASAEDFQGWKGNCIVFYRGCFTSYSSPVRDYDESLCVYDFMLSDCQHLASYLSGVFWPPPTWLQSNACMSKQANKKDEDTQSDADTSDSQDGETPAPIELDPVFVEQIFEAPSTSVTLRSISRGVAPPFFLNLQELAEKNIEMPSTSAARERLTRMEIPSSVMSELEVAEPITEMASTSTTCTRVRRTSAINELEHAAEEGETKFRHPVSRNYITSQSNKSDSSTVKFKGLDIRSNLVKTLQNIWSKHGNLIENSIIRNGDMVSRALESLATAVLILEETTVRSLSDSQADYLNTTLSDLQCMHFKVGWLVPYVEKAVQLHKSKQLMDSCDELLSRQAKVAKRISKLNEELAELKNLEKELEKDVANASSSIFYFGNVDMDKPVGWGFFLNEVY